MTKRWVAAAIAGGLLLAGCARAPVAAPVSPAPDHPVTTPVVTARPEPSPTARLYMTGWTAGSDRFYELVEFMKNTGLNAVVIDAQDDDDQISWATDNPLARELGAHEQKVPDIDQRLRHLKANGIDAAFRSTASRATTWVCP